MFRSSSTLIMACGIVGLLIASDVSTVQAHGLRGTFGGRLLPLRQRCEPMIVECVPVRPVELIPEPKPSRTLLPFPTLDKDLKVNVKALAQLLKNDQKEDARKFAFMVARTIEQIADLEHLYRPRNKGGFGWGPQPGKNPATDGLEKGLLNFAKAKNLANPENVETAYLIAAMGELLLAKAPRKDGPRLNTRKAWLIEAEALRQGALELADALPKDANRALMAAAKINAACVSCHSNFK